MKTLLMSLLMAATSAAMAAPQTLSADQTHNLLQALDQCDLSKILDRHLFEPAGVKFLDNPPAASSFATPPVDLSDIVFAPSREGADYDGGIINQVSTVKGKYAVYEQALRLKTPIALPGGATIYALAATTSVNAGEPRQVTSIRFRVKHGKDGLLAQLQKASHYRLSNFNHADSGNGQRWSTVFEGEEGEESGPFGFGCSKTLP